MVKNRIEKLISICLVILFTTSLAPSYFLQVYAAEDLLEKDIKTENAITIADSVDLEQEESFDSTESYAYDQPEISKLSVTAGKLTGDIKNSNSLGLSLSVDTPGFQIICTPAASGGTSPKITIDGSVVAAGAASQMIYINKGQYKNIEIISQGKNEGDGYGNKTKTYIVKAYRTKTSATLSASNFIETTNGKQLAVTFRMGSQDSTTTLQTLNLAVSYDPTKIQLANKDTNVAISNVTSLPTSASTFNTGSLNAVGKRTVDLQNGVIIIWLGLGSGAPPQVIPKGGSDLITLYFKVLDEKTAFDKNTIKMLTKEDKKVLDLDPPTGLAFMEQIEGTAEFFSSKAPEIATFKGQEYKLTKTTKQAINGSMSIGADKEGYYYGEEVRIFAIPKAGYVFSNWQIDNTQAANIESITANPAKVRMYENKNISSLVPIFVKADVISDVKSTIDFQVPLTGKKILMLNEPYTRLPSGSLDSLNNESVGGKVSEIDSASMDSDSTSREMDVITIDGKPAKQLTFQEELNPTDYVAPKAENTLDFFSSSEMMEYTVGANTSWKTRNLSGSGDTWVEKPFTLIGSGNKTNVWLQEGDALGANLTQLQKDEMLASFENSYQVMNTKYTGLYDRNENQKLDILLYDIQDGYNGSTKTSYYAGLFSANELYTNAAESFSGNAADVIHLDTYPSMKYGDTSNPIISRVLSTMAHETQHLGFSSYFKDSSNPIQMIIDGAKPTWIDEGLSMSVEDELFGVLTSRISKFNSSDSIKNGYISLVNWQSTLENYSLSYLFFQYLKEQAVGAGIDSGFMRSFYRSYAQNEEAELMNVIGQIPAFSDKNMTDALQSFYIANFLKEPKGVFGFNGNPDFNQISPSSISDEPSSLPMGSAVYIDNPGNFIPVKGAPYVFVGIDPSIGYYTLDVLNTTGGSIQIQEEKEKYVAGEPVIVTAKPDGEYEFKGFKGALAGTTNPQTLTINGNTSVSAIFEKIPYLEPDQIKNMISAPVGGTEKPEITTDGMVTLHLEGKGKILLKTKDGVPISNNKAMKKGTPMVISAKIEKGKVFRHWIKVAVNSVNGSIYESSLESGDLGDSSNVLYGNPLNIEMDPDYTYLPEIQDSLGIVELGGMDVLEPKDRKIIVKSIDDGQAPITQATNGFQSGETEYNLHLLCKDKVVVTEGGVSTLKTFVTLRLNFYEDKETVIITPIGKDGTSGMPAEVEYTTLPELPNARIAIATVDVTDASKINITVNGDDVGKEENVYNIYIDQNKSIQDDPMLKIKMEEDLEAGQDKYVLKTSLQRTNLLTAQATIKVTKGALEIDTTRLGAAVTGQAVTNGYAIKCQGLKLEELSMKVTAGAVEGDPEADKYDFDNYDYFTFTVAPTDEGLTSNSAFKIDAEMQVVEIYLKKSANFSGSLDLISDWDKADVGNKIFDQIYQSVSDSTNVIKGDGVSIKGQFKAYNKNAGMEAVVYLYQGSKEDVIANQALVSLASEQEDSIGRYTFNFEFQKVLSGEYLLAIKKPGHTKYTVNGMSISMENIDLTTTLPTGANPELSNMSLICGDLDGDDSVKLMDRDLLMSTKYYGNKVIDFADVIESGMLTEKRKAQINDLDGDGYIKLADLNILMSPANYGKGAVDINYQIE